MGTFLRVTHGIGVAWCHVVDGPDYGRCCADLRMHFVLVTIRIRGAAIALGDGRILRALGGYRGASRHGCEAAFLSG